MNIDISSLIDLVSSLVKYIKDISITLGNHEFSLWFVIASVGTLEAIEFILDARKNNNDEN